MTELLSAGLGIALLILKAWLTGKMDEQAYLAAAQKFQAAEEKAFGAELQKSLADVRADQKNAQTLQDALDAAAARAKGGN